MGHTAIQYEDIVLSDEDEEMTDTLQESLVIDIEGFTAPEAASANL